MINHTSDIAENTIAIESSTWNNIGDAFYQNSIINIFRLHFPRQNIVSFDGPVQRTFRPGKHAKNSLEARFMTDAKHYVFSGPILGKVFLNEYAPLIRSLLARGRSYSLMSVHCSAEGAVMRRIIDFLRECPPTAVHTRDHPTFEKIKGVAPAEMDGICFAFFVSKMRGLPILSLGEAYVCSSYYRGYEPHFKGVSSNADDLVTSGLTLEWPTQLGQRTWRFARFLEHRRPSPDRLGPWKIVRPVHSFSPLPQLIFSKANSYLTYNPDNFLAIYKYCQAVLSDRVHAGVAGLSFGKPVRIEKVDSRFALFEQVPIEHVNGFMRLASGALDPHYDRLLAWLKQDFASVTGFSKSV